MTRKRERPAQRAHGRSAGARRRPRRGAPERASSLPPAAFAACDPRLEAKLAASAGTLLQLLELPDAAYEQDAGKRQLEVVRADELAALLAAVADGRFADAELPALRLGDDAEFQSILAEILLQGDGALPARAAALLGAMHGDSLADLERLTAAIGRAQPTDELLQAVTDALSREVAAAILQHARGAGPEATS
jgi:hypothetical protein